ncbi:MAG TPA: hypothetical protein VF612_09220 [Jatrophihabitans sp.]|uniref:hypothetical protein n=1 Tax=Jatrophihabitans sp. TaxID=1932789 RepID=UPI002EE6E0C8
MADGQSGERVERWLSLATAVAAPITMLSGLLYYFGYVSSRAQYEYFGVDVDTIGLSTQDYVMRSPQPLLVPLLVLSVLAVLALLAHAAISRRIFVPDSEGGNPFRLDRYRQLARRTVLVGMAVLVGGMVVLLCYPYLREWALFALVTPVLIGSGAGLIGYGTRIQARLEPPPPSPGPGDDGRAQADRSLLALRRYAGVALVVVIVANIFWATATIAQWSGRGLAHYSANHLDRLPSTILDTQERLFLRSPGIEETALPASDGQTFRYRYRHLRLLIEGKDRMFLVPDQWSASNSTLIVPLDGSVRVQFQFQNDPP